MGALATRQDGPVTWVTSEGHDVAAIMPTAGGQSTIRFLAGLPTRALPEWAFRRSLQVPTIWAMAWLSAQLNAADQGGRP